MGHTHLPDDQPFDNGRYLNPGSWTRYLDLEKHPPLRLDDLRDEARFPYELNYVVVEATETDSRLVARRECFEKSG
jgi:predicted phosphodiesterase